MAKRPFSLRLEGEVIARLEKLARRRNTLKTTLAERLLDEAIRSEVHPGIMFRDGAAGRSAALAGHRLRVWEVVETVRNHEGDVEEAAGYLTLPVGLVQAAIGYYADHTGEVDAERRQNEELAEEHAATSRRERVALER